MFTYKLSDASWSFGTVLVFSFVCLFVLLGVLFWSSFTNVEAAVTRRERTCCSRDVMEIRLQQMESPIFLRERSAYENCQLLARDIKGPRSTIQDSTTNSK